MDQCYLHARVVREDKDEQDNRCKGERLMFERIIVAIDGSSHSAAALEAAIQLHKGLGAELHLVHVPQIDTAAFAMGGAVSVIEPDIEEVEAAGQALIAKAMEQLDLASCAAASTTVQIGDPVSVILEQAAQRDATLIVVGRRGLGGLGGALLGSVSQRLAKEAAYPLMTVK